MKVGKRKRGSEGGLDNNTPMVPRVSRSDPKRPVNLRLLAIPDEIWPDDTKIYHGRREELVFLLVEEGVV